MLKKYARLYTINREMRHIQGELLMDDMATISGSGYSAKRVRGSEKAEFTRRRLEELRNEKALVKNA